MCMGRCEVRAALGGCRIEPLGVSRGEVQGAAIIAGCIEVGVIEMKAGVDDIDEFRFAGFGSAVVQRSIL